jgi:sortase A
MRLRRLLRVFSVLLLLAGCGTLGWAGLTWRWEDPFTSVYTALEQRELSRSYEERAVQFSRKIQTDSPTVTPTRIRADAKRYRETSRPGAPIGRIRIPRLGLKMIVVNGTDEGSLRRGPGRYLGSYMPGEGELVYLAGHRTTYSAPFSHIDTLRQGDRVTLELPYGTFEYRIAKSVIVGATDTKVLRSHGNEILALQSCHPRFFASQRYIAYARPVRVTFPDAKPLSARQLQAAPNAGSAFS